MGAGNGRRRGGEGNCPTLPSHGPGVIPDIAACAPTSSVQPDRSWSSTLRADMQRSCVGQETEEGGGGVKARGNLGGWEGESVKGTCRGTYRNSAGSSQMRQDFGVVDVVIAVLCLLPRGCSKGEEVNN